MKILLIGSGGREHAIAWKLAESSAVSAIYAAPGNPGIAEHAECVPVRPIDQDLLLTLAKEKEIDLTVVGPEQPLAGGIVDRFRGAGLRIFGPTRAAARLEWSKAFAKEFMKRHSIPSARYRTFKEGETGLFEKYIRDLSMPVVLKADGLAAGKGVLICSDRTEAINGFQAIMEDKVFGNEAAHFIVVEEFLEGEEASLFAMTDGEDYVLLKPAQDHKRVFDGDKGKNTGGMGSFAPAGLMSPGLIEKTCRQIIEPVLSGMAGEGTRFEGCLYVGLMITKEGPKVVEFNSRFGDPETQVVLPLLQSDLAGLMLACSTGTLSDWGQESKATSNQGGAVCVVLASSGYPDRYATGKAIRGLESLQGRTDVIAFHAGTARVGGTLETAGGRVLGITAVEKNGDLSSAIRKAYEAIDGISFEGMHFRKDIGQKGVKREH